MNRIAKIVHHLLSNQEELLAVFYGNVCLLHVDEVELEAIKQVLIRQSY